MRDWSKRLVAGADKKLHPKKVSPSPLAPSRALTGTQTLFSFFLSVARSFDRPVVTLFLACATRAFPSRPLAIAEQFHGSTGRPNLGYTLFLPANPFGRRNTENCSETNSSCASHPLLLLLLLFLLLWYPLVDAFHTRPRETTLV